jgi:hypothetical protein
MLPSSAHDSHRDDRGIPVFTPADMRERADGGLRDGAPPAHSYVLKTTVHVIDRLARSMSSSKLGFTGTLLETVHEEKERASTAGSAHVEDADDVSSCRSSRKTSRHARRFEELHRHNVSGADVLRHHHQE